MDSPAFNALLSTPLKYFSVSPLSVHDAELDVAMECAAMASSLWDDELPITPDLSRKRALGEDCTPASESKRRRIEHEKMEGTTPEENESDKLYLMESALKKLSYAAQQTDLRLPRQYSGCTASPIVHLTDIFALPSGDDRAANAKKIFADLYELAIQRAIKIAIEDDTLTPTPYIASVSSRGLFYDDNLHPVLREDEMRGGGAVSTFAVRVICFGRYDSRYQNINIVDRMLAPVGFQSRFRYAHSIPLGVLVCNKNIESTLNEKHQYRYLICEYTSMILPNNIYQVCANNMILAEGDHPRKCWTRALNIEDSLSEKPRSIPSVVAQAIAPLKRCVAVLNRMVVIPECKHFIHLCTDKQSSKGRNDVDSIVYKKLIKKPISLNCIFKNLAIFHYMTVYEFAFDMRLVFYNAQVYYHVDSEEFDHASKALEIFDFIYGCWVVNYDPSGSLGSNVLPKEGPYPWDSWLAPINVFKDTDSEVFCCGNCTTQKVVEPYSPPNRPEEVTVRNVSKFVRCKLCLGSFLVSCVTNQFVSENIQDRKSGEIAFVCNLCSTVDVCSLKDIMPMELDCPYQDFYLQPEQPDHCKIENMFTGFFWRPLVRLSVSKSINGVKSNNSGSTTGMYGWFERVSVIHGIEQNMKQNKNKFKYLSPSGAIYSTQADMHRMASAESDNLANNFYLGTSFKRRRFRNKSHTNLIRKMSTVVPGTVNIDLSLSANAKETKSQINYLSSGHFLVKTINNLPAEFRRNSQFLHIDGNTLPPDGFFGLSNIGVRLRIEGIISHEYNKDNSSEGLSVAPFSSGYTPVEVSHVLNFILKEKTKIANDSKTNQKMRESNLPTDDFREAFLRLRNYLQHDVVNKVCDFAHDCVDPHLNEAEGRYEIRRKIQLPLPEPLSKSAAAYSLVPGALMTEALTIWQFFQDFGDFLSFQPFSFSDTCRSFIAITNSNSLVFPSIYQLMYDEMATCLTRVLLLDLRNLCNSMDKGEFFWNRLQSKFPINVITWPEIAYRCIITQLYVDFDTDASEYLSLLLEEKISYIPSQFASNQKKKLHLSINHLLEGNPDGWATKSRIAILALLVEKALQTSDLRRHIEEGRMKRSDPAKSFVSKKLVQTELSNRRKHILVPSLQFAINSVPSDNIIMSNFMDDYTNNEDNHNTIDNNDIYGGGQEDISCELPQPVAIPILKCGDTSQVSLDTIEGEFQKYCRLVNGRKEVFFSKERFSPYCEGCGLNLNNEGVLISLSSGLGNNTKHLKPCDDVIFLPLINHRPKCLKPEKELKRFHVTCARAVFASHYISQSLREKSFASALEGKTEKSALFYESTTNSSLNTCSSRLGTDDKGFLYFTLGERRDAVFCCREENGHAANWGVYVGSKKLKILLHALDCRRPLSRLEENLRLSLVIKCDLYNNSDRSGVSPSSSHHPLFQSRLKVLLREYEKSDDNINLIMREELQNRYINRMTIAETEKWKMNMQTAILGKCVELRSTAYHLRKLQKTKSGKDNYVSSSKSNSMSRLRLRIKLSRYEGDEFNIRHSISQTLRELQSQTIAHRLLLDPQWYKSPFPVYKRYQHETTSELPFLDMNFDNLLAIPRLSWDLGLNTENSPNEKSLRRSMESIDLQSLPVVRYAGLDCTLDAVYPNTIVATRVLHSQAEDSLYQQERDHAAFLSGKVADISRTTVEHRQVIQHLYNAINESRKQRSQERLIAQTNGYALNELIIASALGYLGSRTLYGFTFEFASFVAGSNMTCATFPTHTIKEVPLNIPSKSYFDSITSNNEALYNSHLKCIAPLGDESEKGTGTTLNLITPSRTLTTANKSLSVQTDKSLSQESVYVSLRVNNHRFEKIKAELWNICECLPRNSSGSGFYIIHPLKEGTQHDNSLHHEAWAAALRTASTPLDLLYSLNSLVHALPAYWYARNFRLDEVNSLIKHYEENKGPLCESIAPVAVLIYRLDKSIGLHSRIYGSWGNSKNCLGADFGRGYKSLPKISHSPIRIAGGPLVAIQQCSSNILCTKECKHSGPCNNKAIQQAEAYSFPRSSTYD